MVPIPRTMMVAAGQQGLPRWRTHHSGVKSVVFESISCKSLRGRRAARSAKSAGRAKTNIVEHNDEHIRRAFRRSQLLDRREFRLRIFGVVLYKPGVRPIRNGRICR